MPSFTDQDIQRALDAKAEHLVPDDFSRIAQHREVVLEKLAEMPPELSRAVELAKLLFDFVDAAANGMKLPTASVAQAAGAMIYLGAPVDLVPDDIEGEGYLDDAAVVELAAERIARDLRAFCEKMGVPFPG